MLSRDVFNILLHSFFYRFPFFRGLARLMADWLRVGFNQGNFNSDNCSVAGRTLDYGPFGFMEKFEAGVYARVLRYVFRLLCVYVRMRWIMGRSGSWRSSKQVFMQPVRVRSLYRHMFYLFFLPNLLTSASVYPCLSTQAGACGWVVAGTMHS
jgi:hypothetical protein